MKFRVGIDRAAGFYDLADPCRIRNASYRVHRRFEILKIKAPSPLSAFKYSPSLRAIIMKKHLENKLGIKGETETVAFIRFVTPNWYPIGI